MIDFLYRSLFTGETHEEGPSGRALVVQWILLSVVVGLVLASGEGSLVFVFTSLFAAGTIALGVLWQAAWLGLVTRQPAAAYVRVLAAALWPLLLAGPVAAVGIPGLVTADMVKPGAVVIDVGINRNAEGKLVGDVDFAGVSAVAGWITGEIEN